jgi:hypothetical protein
LQDLRSFGARWSFTLADRTRPGKIVVLCVNCTVKIAQSAAWRYTWTTISARQSSVATLVVISHGMATAVSAVIAFAEEVTHCGIGTEV